MTERTLSSGTLSRGRWIAIGIVALFVASAALSVVVVGLPGGAGGVATSAPSAAQSPSCTVTVDSETGQDNAIQTAIDAYGPLSTPTAPVTICIGPGTFPEQLTISGTTDLSIVGAGNGSTILEPATALVNGEDLDSSLPTVALIQAENDVGLAIEDLAVNGALTGAALYNQCTPGFLGIYYADSTGMMVGDSVLNVNNDGGCQEQNAVLVNNGWFATDTVVAESVYIANSTVTAYGKNGITCNDLGITCTVFQDTVATSAMALGYAATNGVQFWAAAGSISNTSVGGNNYLPGACAGGDYFFPIEASGPCGAGSANDVWSGGILILQTPSSVTVSNDTLVGNQVGVWAFQSPIVVEDNTVTGSYYGVVLDNSTYDAVGNDLASGTDQAQVVSDNALTHGGVGVLAYDVNATINGNDVTANSVGVEVQTDEDVAFQLTVDNDYGNTNVSGALLGDVSSYQTGDANPALPVGDYYLDEDSFEYLVPSYVPQTGYGIYVFGASAQVDQSSAVLYANGIAVVTSASGAADLRGNSLTGPQPGAPGSGIYVFAGSAQIESNDVNDFAWTTGPGWWPDSQASGIFAQCYAACEVDGNQVFSSGIGIAVLSYAYGPNPAPGWPYADAPSVGPISVDSNTIYDAIAFGIALELNQETSALTVAPTDIDVSGNSIQNLGTGAVGLMVDQGTYSITGNTFSGTSLSGLSGASQPTPNGTIATASIQVLDVGDSATVAVLSGNSFDQTTQYVAVENVTAGPPATAPYFANVSASPSMSAPTAPSVSSTSLDVDQALTVSGSIPTTGVPAFSWTWLVSENGGGYAPTMLCAVGSGAGAGPGAAVSCAIAADSLTVGATYEFELEVSDGSTNTVTLTSLHSASVEVYAPLTAPAAPTVSATALDADQTLTVEAEVPTTGVAPYSWVWQISLDGGTFATATQCSANSGSGASAGATESCVAGPGALPIGSNYAFRLQVTDSASPAETTTSPSSPLVAVNSALTAPSTPTASASALDRNQALTVTSTLTATGTAPYSWEWLMSVDDAAWTEATVCAVSSGSSSTAGTVTCAVAASTLTAGDSYAFELSVTDSASAHETTTSVSPATVSVASALGAGARPTVNRPALDENQALTVKSHLPTTGTAPYAWTWLVSKDGGAFAKATQCAVNSGTGGAADAALTCAIAAGALTAGDYYDFEIKVTDSATTAETKTSAEGLETVTVATALTAPAKPSVSSTSLDVDQALTVSGTVPATGTSPYAWTWLVNVDGSGYVDATQCGSYSGSGADAGATVSCVVPGNTLTVGDHYAFELKITDGATAAESKTSTASASVGVKSALAAPAAPHVSLTRVAPSQALTVTDKVPTSGTPTYAWQWEVSENGGGFVTATVCAVNGGTGAASGATETCAIAGGTLTPGATYAFELTVTDSATVPQSTTSPSSSVVTVAT